MKITFIRHGHSQSNELNILSSSADDEFYLTDKGVAEIKKAALEFRPSAVENVIFISSPLKRTVHSAQVYMKAIGKSNDELAIDPRIREFDYGNFLAKRMWVISKKRLTRRIRNLKKMATICLGWVKPARIITNF